MTKKMPERTRDARRFRRAFIAMMWMANNSSLQWNDVMQLMFEELLFFYNNFEHDEDESSPLKWSPERVRGLRLSPPWQPKPDA